MTRDQLAQVLDSEIRRKEERTSNVLDNGMDSPSFLILVQPKLNVSSNEIGPSSARYRLKTPCEELNPPQEGTIRRTLVADVGPIQTAALQDTLETERRAPGRVP
jgi:hypothetical protein